MFRENDWGAPSANMVFTIQKWRTDGWIVSWHTPRQAFAMRQRFEWGYEFDTADSTRWIIEDENGEFTFPKEAIAAP